LAASTNKSVAVIGGGVTGLAAAWRLHRAGGRVTLFEKAPSVGGAIVTTTQDGWLIEGGPNSLQETPEVAALLGELGLAGQRLSANAAASKRFIVRRGRLVPVPLSPAGLLVSPLFSPGRGCACWPSSSRGRGCGRPTPASRALWRGTSAARSPTMG